MNLILLAIYNRYAHLILDGPQKFRWPLPSMYRLHERESTVMD
jgi:hypothetical protein